MNHHELLDAFLKATKPSEIDEILRQIGDHAGVTVDTRFGTGRYQWCFYGGRQSNMSTINLASKPGRSLTERVTNAIDAVFELEADKRPSVSLPESPMEAAEQWFGRPPSGVDTGLYQLADRDIRTHKLDRRVSVVLCLGDEPHRPTIDVIDKGIGIRPEDFAKTILSLQEGNKITKRYLAGAWGQGGSSTLAYSKYVLVVSRHYKSPEIIGFTIIKLIKLDEPYKEDAYAYLAVAGKNGELAIPSVEQKESIDIYSNVPDSDTKKPGRHEHGTLVRHYGYEASGFSGKLGPGATNLYHLFHRMMFDPLLPFRVFDVRDTHNMNDQIVKGSRNRLMDIAVSARRQPGNSEETLQSGQFYGHYAPRTMVSPRGGTPPSVGIEYWVVLNYEKEREKVDLRGFSNGLFVDRHHPIIMTFNGQNQGEDVSRLLRDLQLPMVAKHIIIHIDTSQASRDIRNALFSSTREHFKEGEVFTELSRLLADILKEDQNLREIERSLEERMLRKGSGQMDQTVRQKIVSLLKGAGVTVQQPGTALSASTTGNMATSPTRTPSQRNRSALPLPELPFPDVTRFEFVYPKDKLSVHKQDSHLVKLETDAHFSYDRRGFLAIRTEPSLLEISQGAPLQGGRKNWRLRPIEDTQPGNTGVVIATITKPDGTQLTTQLPFEILSEREEPAQPARNLVPAFDVQPVDPETDRDLFDEIWEEIKSDSEIPRIAYKPQSTSQGIIVYYSIGFQPYRHQVEKLKRRNHKILSLFEEFYRIWIGYIGIMEIQHKPKDAIIETGGEGNIDHLENHNRFLIASVQVQESLALAELHAEKLKNQETNS